MTMAKNNRINLAQNTSTTSIVKFEQFMNKADAFLKLFGLLLDIKRNNANWNSHIMNFIFVVSLFNLSLVIASESIFIVVSYMSETDLMLATMNISCIGFASVGLIKIYTILHNKSKLINLITNLRELFPRLRKPQQTYKVHSFLRNYNLISTAYVVIHLLLIWIFNMAAIVYYVIKHYIMHDAKVEPFLPYGLWSPWDWHGNWIYGLLYLLACFAGHTCMSAQLAADLLFGATTTNLIMHYRHLTLTLTEYVAQAKTPRDVDNNRKFLNNFIQLHQQMIRFSDTINDVFGPSLLINFVSSALIMCFLGFQLSIGVPIHYIGMMALFLLCSLIQAYMISNYGQQLSDASSSIADAVYNHEWYGADVSYKKTIIVIMHRAQKPVFLKGTFVLNVTLATITVLIQVSYKCFAMLRLLYAE